MGMFIPDQYSNNNSNNNNNDYNNTIISNDYNSSNNTFINNYDNDNNNASLQNNMFMPNDYNMNAVSSNQFDAQMNNQFMPNINQMVNEIPNQNTFNDQSNNPFASIRQNTERIINDKSTSMFNNEPTPTPEPVNQNTYGDMPKVENNFESSMDFTQLDQGFDLNSYKLPEDPMDQNNNTVSYQEESTSPTTFTGGPLEVNSLDDVLATIKAAVDKVKNGKVKVETDEIDFDDLYQVTIKVSKLGDY